MAAAKLKPPTRPLSSKPIGRALAPPPKTVDESPAREDHPAPAGSPHNTGRNRSLGPHVAYVSQEGKRPEVSVGLIAPMRSASRAIPVPAMPRCLQAWKRPRSTSASWRRRDSGDEERILLPPRRAGFSASDRARRRLVTQGRVARRGVANDIYPARGLKVRSSISVGSWRMTETAAFIETSAATRGTDSSGADGKIAATEAYRAGTARASVTLVGRERRSAELGGDLAARCRDKRQIAFVTGSRGSARRRWSTPFNSYSSRGCPAFASHAVSASRVTAARNPTT